MAVLTADWRVPVERQRAHANRDRYEEPRRTRTCLLAFALSLVFFRSFVGPAIDVRGHGISAAGFGGLMAINNLLIGAFSRLRES